MLLPIHTLDGRIILAQATPVWTHDLLCNLLDLVNQQEDPVPPSLYDSVLSLLHYPAGDRAIASNLSGAELKRIFNGGAIGKLHQSIPDPKMPKYGDRLNIPLPAGGDTMAKLLAQVAIQLGDYGNAIALMEKLTLNQMRSFLLIHGELSRPYEQRLSTYRLDQYHKQISSNPANQARALGFL